MRLSSKFVVLCLLFLSAAWTVHATPVSHPPLHIVWCFCGTRVAKMARASILSFILASSPLQPIRLHLFTDRDSFPPLFPFMQEIQQSMTSCLTHVSWRVYDSNFEISKHEAVFSKAYLQPELYLCSGLRLFAFNSSLLEEDILAWNSKSGSPDENALVIYVDTDTLALAPLKNIQKVMDLLRPHPPSSAWTDRGLNREQWPLIAAADHCEFTNMGMTGRIPHPLRNGLQAGVLAADVTRWIHEGVLNDFLSLIDEYKGSLVYGDQDLLNIFAARNEDRWAEIPIEFNTWRFDCYTERPAPLPTILHGAGGRFWRPHDEVGREMAAIFDTISNVSQICLKSNQKARKWTFTLDSRKTVVKPALWWHSSSSQKRQQSQLETNSGKIEL